MQMTHRKQRCHCGLWPMSKVYLPRVWGALGKVTLLFFWHATCIEGVSRVPPSAQFGVLSVIDNQHISVLVTLFSVFVYRSQWIDSKIHQTEDRQNPYKETGKQVLLTSMALIRIIAHRFVPIFITQKQDHSSSFLIIHLQAIQIKVLVYNLNFFQKNSRSVYSDLHKSKRRKVPQIYWKIWWKQKVNNGLHFWF